LLKKPPRELTIVGTKDAHGQVKHGNLFRGIQLDVDNSDRARLAAERNIMVSIAGEIAQRKAFPRSVRSWQMDGDYAQMAELALRVCGSSEQANAFLKWLRIRTNDLVNAHWRSVEYLAKVLLQENTINAQHGDRPRNHKHQGCFDLSHSLPVD
jgi:hypothetical protein